jgi:putative Holliday junction resolvase
MLDGREGKSARRARQLARQIEEVLGVRVVFLDEWLTTKEAQARLAEGGTDARAARARIDSAAATVLLQAYLEGERARGRSLAFDAGADDLEREEGEP